MTGLLFALLAGTVLLAALATFRAVVRAGDLLSAYRVPLAGVGPTRSGATFIGGLRSASVHASWGLSRLTIRPESLVLGPSWRGLGLLLPTWTFPASNVRVVEAVSSWPNLRGVRLWVGDQAVVFLTPGGESEVLRAAEQAGYRVNRAVHRVPMNAPHCTLDER